MFLEAVERSGSFPVRGAAPRRENEQELTVADERKVLRAAPRRSEGDERLARTPYEVLYGLEEEWAPRLRAVSLAAELQLTPGQVRLAAHCLGLVYRRWQFDEPAVRRRRLKRYSATLVIALSGVGALEYEAGNYWSALWDVAGLPGDSDSQREWGEVYLEALSSFGCPRFSNLPLKYVGPILMHAGIPRYCLDDVVDLVEHRLSVDEQLDGSKFVGWATAGGRESRLGSLDKPAQRFLLEGGEFAVDWLDRLIDLIDRLTDPSPNLNGVRLPEWVIESVQGRASSSIPARERRRAPVSRRFAQGAHLGFDPYGAGVQLVLPPVGDQPDGTASWHVTLDGDLHIVRSRAAWPGVSESVPGTTLTLARPVRIASVALGSSELRTDIDVVDPQDPLILFSEDGRRLPPALPLPPEPVWALFPTEGPGLELWGDGSRIPGPPTPYGWEGWSLERIDLARVHRLRWLSGAWRAVRGSSRARLELAPPVTGTSTAYGGPVYAAPPTVQLPATTDAVTSWSVVVRRPGGNPLTAFDVEVAERRNVDPFADVPRPLVGPYQIVVRGPLGRGLSREIELVEGLAVVAEPAFREFSRNGLVPARVTAEAEAVLSARSAELSSTQTGFLLQASGSGCTAILEVTPPHMAVQVLGSGSSGRWSAGPLRLATECLGELDAVALRLPEQIERGSVLLLRGEQVMQTADIAVRPGGGARLDVRRFADTLGSSSGRLELELLGRRIPLAVLQPRRLASGAVLDDDGRVLLNGCADVEGLTAAVYPLYRPWQQPEEGTVVDGTVGPFPRLLGAGPVLVHLRVDDPWLPAAWPKWPPQENTFRGDAALQVAGGDSWQERLSRWLAGVGQPTAEGNAMAALLAVYERSSDLSKAGVAVPVRDDVAAVLRSSSLERLASAVMATTASTASVTAVLVQSSLACVTREVVNVPATLWSRSASAAVICGSAQLSAGDAAAVEELIAAAGPVAATLLGGGDDPAPSAAKFGPEARRFAAFPKDLLDQIWRLANIVPAQLLDADSRAAAARKLFDAREHPLLRRWAPVAKQVEADCDSLLTSRLGGLVAPALAARRSDNGWQSLPAMSLGLALVARLAARGDHVARTHLEASRGAWVALARGAPELVEIDLVLAECLLLGAGL